VIDQIRGKSVEEATHLLMYSQRGVAKPLLHLLKSAIANADVEGLNTDALVVSEAWVDGGPILKRFMPRAMGRASRINKRTSQVTLILREEN
jgi:large subunit ribosomal protein L22